MVAVVTTVDPCRVTSLTTVRVGYTGFGEAAAARLLAEIDGGPTAPFEPAEPELIARGSTSRPLLR